MTAVAMTGHAPIGADVLTRAEAIALSDCEERIERGMKTFVEVGMALAAIRENRLYRAQYSSFQEYCAARWNFTGRRGNQLIEVAEVGNMFPAVNARQAAELVKVPDAERAEVLAEAAERGKDGKPTAKAIAEVAKKRDLKPDVLRALASYGATGATAWQVAFLIDSARPDVERVTVILDEAVDADEVEIVGETEAGFLWALAEFVDEPTPQTPEPTADPSAAQVGSGPTPGSAGAVDPPADPGSAPCEPEPDVPHPSWPTESELKPWESLAPHADRIAESMEPVADYDPRDRTHGAEFEAYDAAEPPTCLGRDMDCGRPLPCPNHPTTPAERIAAVAAIAPEFVKPAPKPTLTLVPTDDEKRAAERRDARGLLLRAVTMLAPDHDRTGFAEAWARRLGPCDDELSELLRRAAESIATLDYLVEEAGR